MHYLLIICSLLISLTACQKTESNKTIAPQDLLFSINGRGISKNEYDMFKTITAENYPALTFVDDELKEQFIDQELWAQQAKQKLLHENPEIMLRLNILTKRLYAERAKLFVQMTELISEDDIDAEYNSRYSPENRKQVKFRLTEADTEENINNVLKNLKMGADFKQLEQLNNKLSDSEIKEPEWINISKLSDELRTAIEKMEIGFFSQSPIKTANNWVVILLVDSQYSEAPELNKVRTLIKNNLKQQQIALRTRILRKEAKILLAKPTI